MLLGQKIFELISQWNCFRQISKILSKIYNQFAGENFFRYSQAEEMREKPSEDYSVQNSIPNQSSLQDSECLRNQKKRMLKLKKQRIYRLKNHGSWDASEEARFATFMKSNKKIFQCKSSRRSKKIFMSMSKFVASRSAQQCRSHHQKYEIRFGDFENIVRYIEGKVDYIIKNKFHPPQLTAQLSIPKSQVKQENAHSPVKFLYDSDYQPTKKHSLLAKTAKQQARTTGIYNEMILYSGEDYQLTMKTKKFLQIEILLNFPVFLQ